MGSTTSERLIRIAGGILLLGIVLLLLGSVTAIPLGSVGQANRSGWVLAHLLMLFGGVALLLGLPAVYLRQSAEAGWLGLVGFFLLFVGFLTIGFFVPAVQTVLLPWVYDKASCTLGCHLLSTSDGPPLYAWLYTIDQLNTFIGLILLGLATIRAAVFPRGAGYLMAAGGLLALPMIVINVSSGVALVPEVVAVAGVAWIAVSVLSQDR